MTAETTTHDVAVSALDPVTLEVLWNRLLSVANEQQAALMRTASAPGCANHKNSPAAASTPAVR